MISRYVKARSYVDPETGTESILYEVTQAHPDGQSPDYRIACYSDEAAAQSHAKTGRTPIGYG